MNFNVVHSCRILNNHIQYDGQTILNQPGLDFNAFADVAYRFLNTNYSKFHKMDNLSKLGFLAADILLKDRNLQNDKNPYQTGVILSNSNSSLDTDLKYISMVKTGVASPSVFVYSLPNIAIGEICIRHGIKGESTFFISPQYDISSQVTYINQLLENEVLTSCIGGWLELTGQNYDAFLYLVTRNESGKDGHHHTIDTIKKLYLQS